jgi:hypothetical protein
MAGIHRFSEQMIEYGERLSNIADAAEGKRSGRTGTGFSAWVLLPAAGAGLYALVRSDFFARQAKGVVDEAKTRASDLPDELMKSVRRTATSSSNRTQSSQKSPSRKQTRRASARRNGSQRRRKTSSAR